MFNNRSVISLRSVSCIGGGNQSSWTTSCKSLTTFITRTLWFSRIFFDINFRGLAENYRFQQLLICSLLVAYKKSKVQRHIFHKYFRMTRNKLNNISKIQNQFIQKYGGIGQLGQLFFEKSMYSCVASNNLPFVAPTMRLLFFEMCK